MHRCSKVFVMNAGQQLLKILNEVANTESKVFAASAYFSVLHRKGY
jgi:hypothetical protein